MRKSFTIFFFLFLSCYRVTAQTSVPSQTPAGHLKYALRDTVTMDDAPRDELYSRAWRWFSDAARNVPSLLEEANRRYGRFSGTASLPFSTRQGGGNEYVKGRIYFNFTVRVEDGFYTYEVTDFTHVARLSFNTLTTHDRYPYRAVADEEWHSLVWQEMKDKVNAELEPMVESLKAAMRIQTEKLEEYKAIRASSPTNGE
jgi:hypothetical protein